MSEQYTKSSIAERAILVLPSGKRYILSNNSRDPLTEERLDTLRRLMAEAPHAEFIVFDESDELSGKPWTLLIWGPVVQNSYIIVERQ